MSDNDKPREWYSRHPNDCPESIEISLTEEDTRQIHIIEFSAYEKVKDDLRMALEIGVEMQREVNRKQYKEFKIISAKLEIAINCLKLIRGFPMAYSESPESQAIKALYDIEKLKETK